MFDRIRLQYCYLCRDKDGNKVLLDDVKVDDLIAIKHTRKSRYAHLKCAVRYNWIDKKQIEKDYLLPVHSRS
jgi:hypothetical protein